MRKITMKRFHPVGFGEYNDSGDNIALSSSSTTVGNNYGYNAQVAGQPLGKIDDPRLTVLTADGGDAHNMLITQTDIESRHNQGYIASFADGHTEFEKEGSTVLLQEK